MCAIRRQELRAGSPYVILTTLWMIEDFTAESGATRVVPGSRAVQLIVERGPRR
jgi:ectoine hydroxylase-related dioxygenase (phytanoyl-CoA dioxygenase family)